MSYVYVALGGIIGACARHFIYSLIGGANLAAHYATFIVNIIGCFLIGLIVEVFAFKGHLPLEWKFFLVTGILGAFTTFSTFAFDASILIQKNEYFKAIFYMSASVILGLCSYFLAVYLVRVAIR